MIRKATAKDMPRLLEIYAHAREFMKQNGNPNQWGDSYPPRETVAQDIELGRLYVMDEHGELLGVFMYFDGEEPTYAEIDGAWLDSSSYGTIHRVASDSKVRGFFAAVFGFCRRQTPHLRIDTHADNVVMQRALERQGFARCGVIRLENGDPRIAYEYTENMEISQIANAQRCKDVKGS